MPKTKIVYDSLPKFVVLEESAKLPDGKKVKFTFVRRNPATVIVALKDKKIFLLREYRVVLKSWIWNLPGGKMEKGETPLMGAKRELKEETGYSAKSINPMFHSSLNPSYIDQSHYFFVAKLDKKYKQELDKDEMINTKFVSISEALKMIKTGKIIDILTIAGILYYINYTNH